jgi:hypothetical protein
MIGELLRDRLLRWIRMRDRKAVHFAIEVDDIHDAPAIIPSERAAGNGGLGGRLVERLGEVAAHRGHEATTRAVPERDSRHVLIAQRAEQQPLREGALPIVGRIISHRD